MLARTRRGAGLTLLGGAGCVAAAYAEEYRRRTTAPFRPGAPASEAPETGSTLSAVVLETFGFVTFGLYSKFAMQVCNTTHFDNDEVLRRLIAEGGPGRQGRGLVTVSNHVTAVDDPGVVATLIDAKNFATPGNMRWQMCATDRCFKVRALLPFFRAGRILPVLRGGGTSHHFVDDVVRKVEEGEWVHVFPTGKRDPDSRSLGPLKPGVGRIIASCKQTPVVVPFYHYGMERIQCKARGEVLPITFGANMHVFVGEPLDFEPLIREHRTTGCSEQQLQAAIVAKVDAAMRELQARAVAQADADSTGRSKLDRPKYPWS
jgi:monolysocardiolipin acyltransferase